jgi:uncharacterized protein (DUF427 family)
MALDDLVTRLLPGRSDGAHVRARWNGAVIAESADTVLLEGNRYFPRESVREEHVAASSHTTRCPWKGKASYLDVRVGDAVDPAAAWYYPHPSPPARKIRDRVAFGPGVEIEHA